VFALVIGLCSGHGLAQTGRGPLTGIVTDQSGATFPAHGDRHQPGTNVAYAGVSNEAGNYTLTTLPVGTYVVKAEVSGFKTATTKAIQVRGEADSSGSISSWSWARSRTGRITGTLARPADRVGDGRRSDLRHDAHALP